MEPKRVEITFGKDGSVRVEAFNFVGKSCADATAFLNKLFGKPENIALKESYFKDAIIAQGLPSGHCG